MYSEMGVGALCTEGLVAVKKICKVGVGGGYWLQNSGLAPVPVLPHSPRPVPPRPCNKLFLWAGAMTCSCGRKQLQGAGKLTDAMEELIYWGDGISGSKVETWFIGMKGSVASSFKLWFSPAAPVHGSATGVTFTTGFLRRGGCVVHLLWRDPAPQNDSPF